MASCLAWDSSFGLYSSGGGAGVCAPWSTVCRLEDDQYELKAGEPKIPD